MNELTIVGTIFFIFGTIIGSFLNVCIVRMPHEQSVIKPRSHCTKCKKQVAWFDNIPILSFVLLGGRCRHCKTSFSFRYLLVEILTGLIFLGMFLYFGLSIILLPYLFMMSCFVVATFVDFEHRIIPDEISVGGMFAGLMFSLLIPSLHGISTQGGNIFMAHLHSLGISLLGVLIGGGTIYGMGVLGDWLFKKESLGGGDIKLMAMIGAFLGWQSALLTFFIAPFFGALYGIIEMIRTKDSAIAYGPFLVLGAVICLFFQDQIIYWIINGYGIM